MIKSAAKAIHGHGRSRSSSEDSDSDSEDETFWYICGTCNQAFQEERKVKKHRKRIHSTKNAGQIILLTDKQLHPQIILKRSSLEDNIVNCDDGDGLAQLEEAQCEVPKSRCRIGLEFHFEESDQLAPENSSKTRLKRKRSSKRQSQADTSTNGVVTDTQHELVHQNHQISTEGDCLPRVGSTAAAPETHPPRLELSKKSTSSKNTHLMIITQNELLPQVKLVRCERTDILPAPAGPVGDGGSVMIEPSHRIELLKDNSDQEQKKRAPLKKRKKDRRKKDQQELRPVEGQVSLGKQNFSSETINSNGHLKKVEACGSPVRKVASNLEIPGLKIEGYTLAEELNSLEFAEHIPDNNDDWFNSSDSPSPSPQPELVPLSKDTAESSVSAANAQQEQESHNLDYRRLELEEHKHFEQEMIVADDEVENVEEEQAEADDARVARSLRPRTEGQGNHSSDKIDDPDPENNEKSDDDESKDDEMDQDDDDCLYEDSSSDAESTSSCEIPRKKQRSSAQPDKISKSKPATASSPSSKKEKGADTTSPKKTTIKVTVNKQTTKKKNPKQVPGPHPCKICGRVYLFYRQFVTHMKTVHQQQVQVAANEKRFPCTLCEKDYGNIRQLRKHLRNHEWIASRQASCTICKRSFASKRSLSYHMGAFHSTTTTAEFLCSTCGQGFPSQQHLNVHARIHNEKQFKCEVEGCGASFRSRGQWNRHNVSHSEARPFKCPDPACSQAFKTKYDMKGHFKFVHQPDLRRYKCPECPKSYKKSENMKRHHQVTHLGLKASFKCETCEKSFGRKHTLQTHELEEHGKPLEKVFECVVCKKQCASNEQLKKHASMHATSLEHQCTTCGKGFKGPSNLATHLASHLSEEDKKWSCEICGKKFALPHHLRQHASAHGGDGGRSRKSSSSPRDPLR